MLNVVFVVVFVLIKVKWIYVHGEPDTGLIKHHLQKSYHQCVKECDTAKNCESAKYIRLTALCILYSNVHDETPGPGVTMYTKAGPPMSTAKCENSEDCQYSCGDPEPISGTEILGNMVSVGSKIKYKCIDGSNSGISECLSTGKWSLENITCNCSKPGVEKGLNAWMFNKTTGKENVFCNRELSAFCQVSTGMWYNITNCCNPCNYSVTSRNTSDGIYLLCISEY